MASDGVLRGGSDMRRRTIAALVAVVLLTPTLVVVSALADLRSPDRTAEVGTALANDPGVQSLLVIAVVDAMLDDAVARSPIVAPLAPLLRPLLTRAAEVTVASPAGRAAIASALTDVLLQLTLRGPIVLDLRAAVAAAAEEAPPPLDALARVAVAQGAVGLVVIGDDRGIDAAELTAAADAAGRIAGMPSATAVALVLLALIAALILLGADRAGRRTSLRVAGVTFAAVGVAAALLVRMAPDVVIERLAAAPHAGASPLTEVLPVLVDGLAGLLTRTGAIGIALAGAGALLLAVATLSASGSPHPADRPPPA